MEITSEENGWTCKEAQRLGCQRLCCYWAGADDQRSTCTSSYQPDNIILTDFAGKFSYL